MSRDPAKLFPHDYLLKPLLMLIPPFVRPNHITVFRMLMTPVVLGVLYFELWAIGIPLFFFVGMTDALDGSLARVRKQITQWGTFYDPVADKLLIGSILLLVVIQHVNPALAAALILVELGLILSGWYRRRRYGQMGANIWGKVKMILEGLGILFLLIALWGGADLFVDLSEGTLIVAVIFAIVSLLTYSL